MKKLLFFSSFVLCLSSHAATYYFSSSSGDDSRSASQAQSASTPWKSIAKLNRIFATLQPGDQVLFKRGDTFHGSIVVARSGTASAPIVLSAYGSGVKPIITGLTPITSWVNKGSGIYESTTTLPCTVVNQVLVNGRVQPMGRFPNTDQPNKGYLIYESFSGNTSIIDNELPASPNWTGAEAVVRTNRWTINKAVNKATSGA